MNLRTQMLVLVVLPAAALLGATLAYDRHITVSELRVQHGEDLGRLAIHGALALDARLREAVRGAETARTLIEDAPALPPEIVYAHLRRAVQGNPMVHGSAVAFAPGTLGRRDRFAAYVRRGADGPVDEDISASAFNDAHPRWEWWKSPEAGRRPFWSRPFAEGNGPWLVSYALPFERQGIFAGVVVIDLALPALTAGICGGTPAVDVRVRGSGSLCDPAAGAGNVPAPAAPGVLQLVPGLGNRPPLWRVAAPVESAGWTLTAALPRAEAVALAEERTRRLAAGAGAALLAVLAGILVVSGRILRRVTLADEAAQAVMAGNYALDLECADLDELGDMIRNLHNMTVHVASRESDLRLALRGIERRGG